MVPVVFGDDFCLVEKRQQVAARFEVGTQVEETAFLVEALVGEDEGIA